MRANLQLRGTENCPDGVSGRSLIEILVVISLMAGMLFGFFFPLLKKVREETRRHRCAHNLKEIGWADLRHEMMSGHLVPARLGPDSTASLEVRHLRTPIERSGASGFVLMLPYYRKIPRPTRRELVEKLDVFDNNGIWPPGIFGVVNWRTAERIEAIGTRPRIFVCPAAKDEPRTTLQQFQHFDPLPATGNYAFVAGHRGVFSLNPVNACLAKHHNSGPHLYWTTYALKDIEDGASNTISVGEVYGSHTAESSNIWTYTLRYLDCFRVTDVRLNTPPGIAGKRVGTMPALVNGAFASRHPRGANFVYVDGHVEFMNETIDFDLYQNLSTIAGTPQERDAIDQAFCNENRF